jgi:hypothetical protein
LRYGPGVEPPPAAQGPLITDISPSSVGGGSWDATVTINGSGFAQDMQPYYGDHSGAMDPMTNPVFVDATRFTGVIPAKDLGAPRTFSVFILNDVGDDSNDVPFRVT